MTATVIQMSSIQPKQAKRNYKGHKITITYLPPTKNWKWEIEYQPKPITYSEECKNLNAGFKAAERYIDKLIDIKKGI